MAFKQAGESYWGPGGIDEEEKRGRCMLIWGTNGFLGTTISCILENYDCFNGVACP